MQGSPKRAKGCQNWSKVGAVPSMLDRTSLPLSPAPAGQTKTADTPFDFPAYLLLVIYRLFTLNMQTQSSFIL